MLQGKGNVPGGNALWCDSLKSCNRIVQVLCIHYKVCTVCTLGMPD